jgi:hypothetical protein
MDELMLFGEPMKVAGDEARCWNAGPILATIWRSRARGMFSWQATLAAHSTLYLETSAQARDDCERTIRELYGKLGEVIEPWRFDGHPETTQLCLCCESPGSQVDAIEWNAELRDWFNIDGFRCVRPYAWREMPKAPPRKGAE